ncbi:Selenoprotein M [Halotydeus destructor]|nr:Selenoprotein M [Halotydeus destructor]
MLPGGWNPFAGERPDVSIKVYPEVEDQKIVTCIVEGCKACRLSRLPGAKDFVYKDLPYYNDADFDEVNGEAPVMLFLNQLDQVVKEVPIRKMSRDKCNKMMTDHGFKMREKKRKQAVEEEEVPKVNVTIDEHGNEAVVTIGVRQVRREKDEF